MSNRKKKSLMNPKANSAGGGVNESWYQIKAAQRPGGSVLIYLYDLIGGWGISAQQFINDCRDAGVFDASAIELHIHSPGGDVMDGLAIFNTLSRLTAKIDIYVDGMAASMASVIVCLPGATVHMPENAWLMIHKPWGGVCGDADDIRDYAEWLDRNESMVLTAYEQKSGLSRDEIAALLKTETWIDGAQALEMGFADVVEAPLEAAASLNKNKLKEFNNMPQSISALFAPRASASQTNNPVTPASPVNVVTPPVAPGTQGEPVDVVALATQLQQQMQTANAARVTGIKAVFEAFPAFAALRDTCITDPVCTEEQARNQLLTALAAGTTPTAGPNAHIYAGNGNIVGDSIRSSLMSRTGHASAEADNPYNGLTLREMARAALNDRGIGVAGTSPIVMIGMAFTHSRSDFGNILMDVAHKSALQGWDEANESFDRWTRKGTLTDFKVSHRVGLNTLNSLRKVRPGAEYKYITVGDTGESIVLATYGELFSIDRQTIINDDLSMLTRIPAAMGAAARATIGDLAYAVLTGNPAMSDKKALFSTDHKNLVKAPLSIEGLDIARQAMLLQKSGERRLNIRPAFMLTPVALESRAKQLINSASVPGADVNSGIGNPIQGFAEVISEARLDDASAIEWYLTAAQGRDTIEVAYLDGVEAPYLEQQQGFTVDGAAFKVRIDAGVAPLDYRGLVKSTGQA